MDAALSFGESVPHPTGRAGRAAETTVVHTRMIRLSLAIEESRTYWERFDPDLASTPRAITAFEQRWFGNKSLERIRFLLASLSERYGAVPEALSVLHRWRAMDSSARQMICHWHTQLSDPLYRRFTGEFLVARRGFRDPKVDRDATLRWVKSIVPDRWSEATAIQIASKLLSAASEAGLISPKRDPRALLVPKVSDLVLAYLFYLLRAVDFAGTFFDNPYLASVGLSREYLEPRLQALPGISFRRLGSVADLEWEAPCLTAWAEAHL